MNLLVVDELGNVPLHDHDSVIIAWLCIPFLSVVFLCIPDCWFSYFLFLTYMLFDLNILWMYIFQWFIFTNLYINSWVLSQVVCKKISTSRYSFYLWLYLSLGWGFRGGTFFSIKVWLMVLLHFSAGGIFWHLSAFGF